jgi:tetratricopeptide (TPR) repeat protein
VSEEPDSADRPVDADDLPQTGAAALAIALDGASRAKADAFLDEQTAFIRMQTEHLHEQRELLLSHLRWRRYSDWMRVGGQSMLVLVGALVFVMLCAALWKASQANGLVVEAFTVPPDFVQRGIAGDVVAADVTERLSAVRHVAMENSYSISRDVSDDRDDDIKVEIPDTGISFAEAWRFLRGWLGHERRLRGSLRDLGDGKVAITAGLNGEDAVTVTGPVADLGALEKTLAEQIFGLFDPVNVTNYFTATGRMAEAYAAASRYVPIAAGRPQRADSYGLWSYTTAYSTGDIRRAVARAQIGVDIDPALAVPHVMLGRMQGFLGHDEEALQQDRAILPLRDADQLPAHRGRGFAAMRVGAAAQIDGLLGDFGNPEAWNYCVHTCPLTSILVNRAETAARDHDPSAGRALIARAFAAGAVEDENVAIVRLWADVDVGAWRAAASDGEAAAALYGANHRDLSPKFVATVQATTYRPLVAAIEAHLGEFARAHRTIDATPADCYSCVRIRGLIDGLQKNWGGAAYWFADAVKQAPSIPFAYFDWGRMLLAKGDLDAAIAKFAVAHEKGPHFADPLEMWGEALIAENRSDLALAKFAEANQDAPNWGRLHLKWGEALLWCGDKAGAAKQFAVAARLDLSTPERVALARGWRG